MNYTLNELRKWTAIIAVIGTVIYVTRFLHAIEISTKQNKINIVRLNRENKVLDDRIDSLNLKLNTIDKRKCYGRL